MAAPQRMKTQSSLIYGIRPLLEAIKAGKEIDKVLIKKGLSGDLFMELYRQLVKEGIPYQFVPVEKLNRITNRSHQGVVAFLSMVEYQSLDQLIPFLFDQGRDPFLVVLDHITDVRNLGSIGRTAECAGVDALVVPMKGSAQITADAVKTSAGALHSLAVCRVASLRNALQFMQESGIRIIAATEKARQEYHRIDYRGPVAIVLGSEDKGIAEEILSMAHEKVRIPVMGKIASLNVSNAAAVILYEAVKQRLQK